MDMELGEIRMEEDEEAVGTFRDGAEVDDFEKEKSKDAGKHKSKDRKKGRHEDRDYKHREKEKSVEREYEEFSGRESGRYDPRDNDRYESSRADYNIEKEHKKERSRDKERNRDKHRDKDHEREKTRDKERDKDKGKDRDRERESSIDREHDRGRDRGKDRRKERDLERGKDVREDERGKERDHDRSKAHERDTVKDLERERDRERREKDQDRRYEKEREKEKDRDRIKDRERSKEKSKDLDSDRYKEKERAKDKEKDKAKDKIREKERENLEKDHDQSRAIDREKDPESTKESEKGDKKKTILGEGRAPARKREDSFEGKDIHVKDDVEDHHTLKLAETSSASELPARVLKMKEERMKKKSDSASEISSWVSKSRKLEEKKVAGKEARRHSKRIQQQEEDSEDDEAAQYGQKDLAGVKILHGLDKVIEGGAVVLTLKDQDIIVDGDVNEEADMLENVEIGEQKNRDELYKAAKKRTGVYDDKFNDDVGSQRKILPQYDDPIEDEGVELDESGQFTGEAEKKLEELRKRIEGSSAQRSFEDLSASARVLSDYYTADEMLQFKKPKKKKSLRKKATLDLDALEAEAISSGLGAADRGSRKDVTRQTAKEEQEKADAKMRIDAYQTAYAKAEEASKVLRHEQTLTVKSTEDEDLVFGDDYEDLQKSLEQARKLSLRKQDEAAISGPQAVALLAAANKVQETSQTETAGEPQEQKVVITEMEEFVLGLQINEETGKPESEDVFMDVDDVPQSYESEMKDDVDELTETKEVVSSGVPENEGKVDDATPDEIIHEVPVGKGLAGALNLLKDRGVLKETIDWGGRNMDKKKSKLVGLDDNDGPKEIRIERTDEFGRIMTPKEAFRMLSHKFHGKGPGKMKQEKRMKQYEEDLKAKQMQSSDTPLLSMQKMREAQAQLKTPYLVLSGHVKPGQTSDPRGGFATVEKDHLGSLTPMLGDKKVEHFLGIKRKPEGRSMGLPPLPKKPKN